MAWRPPFKGAPLVGVRRSFVRPVDVKELVNRLNEFNVKSRVGVPRRGEGVKEGVLDR